jgi:AraC-like DNA-binding protein
MQLDLPYLFVLHTDLGVRTRLRAELRATFRVQDVGTWDELREVIRRSPPNAAAVVDPYHESEPAGAASDRLRRLLSEFPSSPVIAAYSIVEPRIEDTQAMIAWGVAEVLDMKRELTGPALLRRLDAVRSHRMRLVLEAATPRFLPSRARALLSDAAEVVAAGGKAPDLAHRLGAGERTLHRWCAKFGLPEPRRLLAWLRVLLAADMLCEGDRAVAPVARACGYASDASLRNALRVIANTTPADVKAKGFDATVAAPFAEELASLRDQGDAAKRAKAYLN